MRRAIARHAAGDWPAEDALASITLAWIDRHRRRIRLIDDNGEAFLLDLPQTVMLGEGDGLRLEDGGWIVVRAAAEDVVETTSATGRELARIAWHLGNRHVPLQILPDGTLRILHDHVLVAMLNGLGAAVERRAAAFQPEPGAYSSSPYPGQHPHDEPPLG
jgi:urease accessory protein